MKAYRVFVVSSSLLFSVGLLPGGHTAQAATSTATLTITANVVAFCVITGNTLAFGTIQNAAVSQSSSLGVLCTNTTPYTIGLGPGAGSGATITSRSMTAASGGFTMPYTLTSDSAGATNWGNTTATGAVSGTGTGLLVQVPVYGRVTPPTNGTYAIGTYTDTVTATLTY